VRRHQKSQKRATISQRRTLQILFQKTNLTLMIVA